MTPLEITSYLRQLFEAHEIECITEHDWAVPRSELPALRALWYPGESSGRLEVRVLLQDNRIIDESFAGVGTGDKAVHDALTNFTVNSFHVLLASLWGLNDPDQVVTENWTIGEKRFSAFIGNFGTRGSVGVTPQVPDGLFASIASAIKSEILGEDIHWFRLFFGNIAGAFTFEALRDNEPWEAGVRCLENIPWLAVNGYYSVRLFVVLRAS